MTPDSTVPSAAGKQARDVTRALAFALGSSRALPEPSDVAPLYSWGWLPLLAGCGAISAAGILLSEVLLARLGYDEPDPTHRALLVIRAVVISFLLAAWAGWYVLRIRRRIERARVELLERRRALEAEAARAEQRIGLGACARILAHEIRNPLNTMAIHCRLLERRARDADGAAEPLRQIVGVLQGETTRLERLVDDYIEYAQQGRVSVNPVTARLEDIVRSVVDESRDELRGDELEVVVDAPAGLPAVRADRGRMTEVVRHLLWRARESSPPGGTITLRLRSDPPCVLLSVHDEGPPFANPEAVFRPFFRESDAGSAFTLAIVRDILRAHGGDVHATNEPGAGPVIAVRVPAARPA